MAIDRDYPEEKKEEKPNSWGIIKK